MFDWIPWIVGAVTWPIFFKLTNSSPVATGLTLTVYGTSLAVIHAVKT